MSLSAFTRTIKDKRGTAAVEFAIVGPIFLSLCVGMLYVCLLLFSVGSMQYAVEESARCASVKTTVCTSNSATQTYAQNAYYGPLITPTFTASTAACGHRVNGTATFSLNTGLRQISVPLTAVACFP
jgi:Flp pilus assembly protein TadG